MKALPRGLEEVVDLASSIHMLVGIEHRTGLHPGDMAMVDVVIGTDTIGVRTTGIIEYHYNIVCHLRIAGNRSAMLY